MQTRREFLAAAGLAVSGFAAAMGKTGSSGDGCSAAASPGIVEIRMRSDAAGANVWFDPVGILIAPGQTVRWVIAANVHTTTAYHPRNGNHSLRIPENAAPWNSGYLVNPGDHFMARLDVEGVYDYFCMPHEMAGMVGRIIVGRPVGPGALPFDYYKGKSGTDKWLSVPEAARKAFPSVERIMLEKVVHLPPVKGM